MGIDLTNVKTTGNFEPVPNGIYDCFVKESVETDTRAGDGKIVKLKLEITGPTHKGQIVHDTLNIVNKNPTAATIGLERLKSIKIAGKAEDPNTYNLASELTGLNLSIKTEIQSDTGFAPKARVKYYMPVMSVANTPESQGFNEQF